MLKFLEFPARARYTDHSFLPFNSLTPSLAHLFVTRFSLQSCHVSPSSHLLLTFTLPSAPEIVALEWKPTPLCRAIESLLAGRYLPGRERGVQKRAFVDVLLCRVIQLPYCFLLLIRCLHMFAYRGPTLLGGTRGPMCIYLLRYNIHGSSSDAGKSKREGRGAISSKQSTMLSHIACGSATSSNSRNLTRRNLQRQLFTYHKGHVEQVIRTLATSII